MTDVGGGERYAYELARHMSRATPTRLVAFGNRAEAFRDGGLEVRVIGRPCTCGATASTRSRSGSSASCGGPT
jgi:hypothetical protein